MQFLFLPFLLCAIFWSQFAGLCRAQTPTISQTIPTVRNPSPPEQFSGETFCAPFRFANTGATGYGPYVRLILPPGITFNNATFGAGALTTTSVGTIPASGFILDPVTSADAFINATDTIFGAAGSTVVLLRYPVGSIITGGIVLDATVCYTIGAAATIGTPLTIRSQGVYQFGNDATGVNGPIVGTVLTNSVVPILYIFDKITSTSVEPGVCHTYPYNLNVNIAGGRSLTGTAGTPIVFQDVLPANLQFVGLIGALPAGCVTTSLPSTVTPGGTLSISCVGTYTGTTGTVDMSVNFNAYVPDILNEAICDRTTVTNPATFIPGVGAGASSNDQVQTEVTHVNLAHTNNQGSTSPGSTILYTIAASISEYTAGISAAIITFVVPDGMSYNPASLQWGGAPVSAANVTVTAGTGSGSVVAVNVHNQQGANISPCGSPSLTYTADVLQNYVVGGGKVLGRDTLTHTSSIRYNLVEGATNCLDAASTRSVVINLNFNKAVDNAPPTGTGRNGSWWPGDTVRYRLTLNIPSRDLNNVVITDFLPLPIHVVTDIPTAFGAGQMLRFHPSSAWTTAPTVTRSSATNSLAFNFGNVTDNGTGNPVDIVILVEAPITTLPFADGLFYSNFMEVRSDNSSVDNPSSNTLTTIQVAAPDFTVTKGVLATNNPRSTISPSASIIPTDGNITNVDANDTLRYRITIQNDGLAPGYDLRIQDQAPASLQNCALAAPNPVATGTGAPGTGTAFNFTGGFIGNSLTINIGSDSLRWAGAPVANSLMHVDYYCVVRPNVQAGQLFNNTVSVSWASIRAQTTRFSTQTNAASGAVASPTLSKRVNAITPGYAAATDRVTIGEMVQYQLNFIVPEGNLNLATVFDVVDAGFAFVRIDSIVSRNTSGGNNITASAGSFSTIASAVTISNLGAAATQIDRRMDLNFGNITNVDVDNLNDTIKIFYSVRLINDPINVNGRTLSNNATVSWENPNSAGNFLTTNVRATNLTVAEAQTQVVKTMSPGSLLPGRNSFVTLSVTNPSSSPVPAYNVQITDQLPQGMIFVSGFSTSGNARLSAAYSNAGGTVTARWDTILPGQTSVATFEIQASSGITPCVTLTNCASITWQSLTAAAAVSLPPAFSSTLGVPRTGDISNIGGAANTYLRGSCAPLRVIIDNSFDPVITGNNQACAGGRATMTIRQYNAQIVRYRWTGPGVPVGFNSNELIIDPVTAADTGTYYVFVELDGCTTDTSNFFRLQLRPTPPTPVISAAPNPVCEGASLALSTSTVANGYQWSGPNGFSSNLQTPPIINPVALSNAGTYTLVTTNTFGCSSTAASVNITVRPRPARPAIQNNVSICSNQNLVLNTNTTAPQYRWISPNGRDTVTTTSSLTILPTNVNLYQSGVWTLAVQDANGCESVPSLGATVVINQTPPKPVADNNGPICQGEDVLLSVSPFPNSFYEWFSNPALTNRIAASQNPVISNLTAAGSPYTYYVRTTSLNGCASDTASTRVIVRTVPAAVSPTQNSPCAGDTLRLQSGVTATIYSWSGPGGFYSNLQNPIIANADASNAGSYVITITDANGCSNVGAVQVPVRPRPNTPRIVFTSPLCVGNTLNLTANNYTGTNVVYTWGTPTGTSVTGVPSLTVVSATLANNGRYSLRVNVDGCTSLPDSVNIVVNPNPAAPVVAATPNPVCEGGSLQLSTTTNAPFYNWSGANGFSSNLANPAAISPVTTANAGTYSLFVRDANNCQSPATNVVVTVTPRPAQPAVSSNSSICRGSNLILSTSATGLTSYRWIAPNGQDTTVTTNPLTILPTSRLYQNGNFTLVGINANGCASVPSAVSLVVINDIPAAPIATNGSPVCAGGAVKLNASNVPNANYIWTNPSGQIVGTQQNIDVFPTVSGNYSVMAVVNGCSSTLAATAVTVNPSPAAPSVPANFTVCEGSSISFSTTTTAASYLWTGVNGFSSTQQNPLVTTNALPTDAGVYRLVVTNANGCTSTASSLTVTVSPRPSAPTLSATTPVCRGNNLVFSSGNTANTYMWIAPNGATTTTSVASLTVSPASALYQSGNWGLSVGNAAGCFSLASIPVNVQIADTLARPAAFNNGAICNGSSVQLSTAFVSGASYQWYSDAALTQLVSTQQNPTVSNVTATQAYFVVLTNAAGCRSQAGSTTVTVRPAVAAPAIAATPNPVCEGGSLQLSTSTIAASYMWSGANGFSSMQQTPSAINPVTLADAGTYTLRIVDANGCTSALASVVVTVNAQPTTASLTAASPVCRGNNLIFNTSSTASVYMWIAPNGATTTTSVASLTVSPASALYQSGNWGLSVGNAAGCFSMVSVPTMVQIADTIARPSAFNNGAICNGSAVQLSTAFVSGASYQWYSDAALTQLVSTQQNPTVSNVTATQAYFVVLTNAAGCRSQAGNTTVTVRPAVAAPAIAAVPNPVCEGGSLQLSTSTVAASYMWSGANGFSSMQQTPAAINPVTLADAGTYTLRIVDANGCTSALASVNVTVNAAPSMPFISNNSAICTGQNLILSSTTVADSFRWTAPNGRDTVTRLGSLTITSGNTNFYQSGNWVLRVRNAAGCYSVASANSPVVINNGGSAPIAINNSPVCVGSSVTLTTPNAANATYTWYSDAALTTVVATTATAVIPNITTTSTFYLVVGVSGCTSSPASTIVTTISQPAAPNVPANFAVCEGGIIQLSTTTVANAYNWTGVNGFVSNQQNPAAIAPAILIHGGVYRLITSNASGCQSAPAFVTVTVNALPNTPSLTAVSPVCRGNNLVFNTSSTSTIYSWIAPNGQITTTSVPSLTVSPASATYLSGDWMLSVTNANGCTSDASVAVNVQIADTIARPSAFNNGAICNGSAAQLSTAFVSGASYQWYSDAALTQLVSTQQNPTVSNVTATQAYFVVLTNAAGCRSQAGSTTVTVRPAVAAPAIAATPNPVCEGGSLQLSTSTLAASYMWSGANGFSSMQQTPAAINPVTLADAGTYTLRIVDANGCTSALASVNVTVTPSPATPALATNNTICRGQNISLTTTATATQYRWIAPNGLDTITTNRPITIAPSSPLYQAGNWMLAVRNASGCESQISLPSTMTINEVPATPAVFNNSPVCINGAVQLSTAPVAGATYQWYRDAALTQLVSTQQNPIVNNITANTSFFLVVTSNGCSSGVGSTNVTVSPVAPAPAVPANFAVCEGQDISLSTSTLANGYEWTGVNGFFSNRRNPITIQNAQLADAGEYRLVVYNGIGCASDTARVTVTVNSNPVPPVLSANAPICQNDTLRLSTTASATVYTWIAPNGATTTTTVPSLNLLPANALYMEGNWQLAVQNASGCSTNSNFEGVTINPRPSVSAFNTGAYCLGQDVQLTATFINDPSVQYYWYRDAARTQLLATSREFTVPNVLVSTRFYVEVSVQGCFSNMDSTLVTILPSPTVTAGYLPNCTLDTLFLTSTVTGGTAPYTYWWNGVNSFTSHLQNPSILNSHFYNEGSYVVTVTDANGCEHRSTVEVDIYPKPATPTIQHNAPVCVGNVVTLYTQPYFGLAVDYFWTRPNGTVTVTQVPMLTLNNATFADTGVYSLRVRVDSCYSLPGQEIIRLYPRPATPNVPANMTVCQGDSIILNTGNTASTLNYFWTGSNGFQSNIPSPRIVNASPADSGRYYLFVENMYGCRSNDTSTYVSVNPSPSVRVIASNAPICFGDTLRITANQTCATTQWYNQFGTPITAASIVLPSTSPNYVGGNWYMICTDANGCTSRSNTLDIEIKARPDTPAVFNNSPICVGGTVQLSTAQVANTTYQWFSNAGLTNLVSTSANPTFTNISTDSTFYLVITTNGCRSNAGSTRVRVRAVPAAPNVNPNITVCEGQSIVLSTNTPAAQYFWTGSNGFSSTLMSPSVVNATAVDSGMYYLYVIDANGCRSRDTSLRVSVSPIPAAPVASSNSPVCDGQTINLFASAGIAGTTYQWTFANNGSNVGSGQTFTRPSATPAMGGYYYVVPTLNGCVGAASNQVLVNVNQIPASNAFAGIDLALCNKQTTTLEASPAQGATGRWTTTAPSIIANPTQATTSVNNLPTGNSFYVWTLSNDACANFSSDTVQISNTPVSNEAAFAGIDQTLCGTAPLTLSATAPSIATGRWTQTAAQAGTGVVITNPNSPTSSVTGLQQGNNYAFTWSLVNGNCGEISNDVVNVTVNVAPIDNAYAGQDISLCNVNVVNMSAAASTFGTGRWTTSSGALIVNPMNPNTTVANLPAGANMFIWTLSNGACANYSRDTAIITNSSSTDVAEAGVNQVSCGQTTMNLSATTPSAGTGRWIQSASQAAQGVVILNPNSPTSQVTNLQAGGVYNFTWILSNGTCIDYSSDITTISISNTPTDNAFAGMDVNLCGANTTSLQAAAPSVGTGQWTTNSSASIVNPNNPSTQISNLPIGANVFVWTLSNGTCLNYDNDTVVINVTNPSSDVANAGLDTSYCNAGTLTLQGNNPSPAGGMGTWTQSAAQAGLGAGITNPNSPNSTVTGLQGNRTYVFNWTFSNGGCVNYSSDSVVIRVDALPNSAAFAGNDTILCGGSQIQMNATLPLVGTGLWSFGAPAQGAIIVNPSLHTTQVVNLPVDTTRLVWTLTNGSCRDYAIDTVVVIRVQGSTDIAGAGLDRAICGVDSATIVAATPTTSTGIWTQSAFQASQGVTISSPSSPQTSARGLVPGNAYTFRWTLSTLGCPNFSTDEVTITINTRPSEVAYAGNDLVLCNTNQTTITQANNPAFSTGVWSSASGAVIINPTQYDTRIVNVPVGVNEFYWTLSNGTCVNYSQDTLIINVINIVDTADAGLDISLCAVDSVVLRATNLSTSTGQWSQSPYQSGLGVVIESPNSNITVIRGLQIDSSYNFRWTLSNGLCRDYDSDFIGVQVSRLPADVAYGGADFTICGVNGSNITATTPTLGAGVWTTNNPNIVIVNPTLPTTEVLNLGQGQNTLIWTLSNGSCRNYSRDTLQILVDRAPVANSNHFDVIYNSNIPPINVIANDSLTPQWTISLTTPASVGQAIDLADGRFQIVAPDVLATQTFIYQVCNPNCPVSYCDTALVTVDIRGGLDCEVPNVFTPNGDGTNDALVIPCLQNFPNSTITIFNRWGDEVFSTNNYQNNWEGTYNGGFLPDGTYFYILQVNSNPVQNVQGFVELRR